MHGYLHIHKMCLRCLSIEWAPLDKTSNHNPNEMPLPCILFSSDTCSLSTFPPKHELALCWPGCSQTGSSWGRCSSAETKYTSTLVVARPIITGHCIPPGNCKPPLSSLAPVFLILLSLSLSLFHYNDVKISVMASQITSLAIVYSTVYSGADQRKHQSSASLAFVRGIQRWPVNSPHKGPLTRKMFTFDDVVMSSLFFSLSLRKSNPSWFLHLTNPVSYSSMT